MIDDWKYKPRSWMFERWIGYEAVEGGKGEGDDWEVEEEELCGLYVDTGRNDRVRRGRGNVE
jgi:hypothetical protein